MPRYAWKTLDDGPLRAFFEAFDTLWKTGAAPSGHRIAAALKKEPGPAISQGTVNNLINGPRLPRWETVSSVVMYLHGDTDEFLKLWLQARDDDTIDGPKTEVQESESRSAPLLDVDALREELYIIMKAGFDNLEGLETPEFSKVVDAEFDSGEGPTLPALMRRNYQASVVANTIIDFIQMLPNKLMKKEAITMFAFQTLDESTGRRITLKERREKAGLLYQCSSKTYSRKHEPAMLTRLVAQIYEVYEDH